MKKTAPGLIPPFNTVADFNSVEADKLVMAPGGDGYATKNTGPGILRLAVPSGLPYHKIYGWGIGDWASPAHDAASKFFRASLRLMGDNSELGKLPFEVGYLNPADGATFPSLRCVLNHSVYQFAQYSPTSAWQIIGDDRASDDFVYYPTNPWFRTSIPNYDVIIPWNRYYLHAFNLSAGVSQIRVDIDQCYIYTNIKLFLACVSYA